MSDVILGSENFETHCAYMCARVLNKIAYCTYGRVCVNKFSCAMCSAFVLTEYAVGRTYDCKYVHVCVFVCLCVLYADGLAWLGVSC